MLLLHQEGRKGAGRSGVVEQRAYLPSRASIWKFYIRKPSIVIWDTYILPITFFMYGLSLYIKSKTLQPSSSSSYSSSSSSTSHKAQSLRCCIQLWSCTSAYKRTVWDAHNMRRKNLHSHEIITRGRKYVLAKTTRTFK